MSALRKLVEVLTRPSKKAANDSGFNPARTARCGIILLRWSAPRLERVGDVVFDIKPEVCPEHPQYAYEACPFCTTQDTDGAS